jgi:acyl-coenzyme A thioesterase PaaI-like protein
MRSFLLLSPFAILSCVVGVYLGAMYLDPAVLVYLMSKIPSDEATLSLFEAPDEESRKIDDYIRNCSFAEFLRQDPEFKESRPHLKMPKAIREHNLTGGTLAGPGMLVVPPYVWSLDDGSRLFQIFYVGDNVSGHPGIVHGGFLATMLDEGMARCCFPALPGKFGVTAALNITYQKPTKANQYLVLIAKTHRVEGRKAFVSGSILTMPLDDHEATEVLVTAEAVFVEPKNALVGPTSPSSVYLFPHAPSSHFL